MMPFDMSSYIMGYQSGKAQATEKNSQRSHQDNASAQDPEQHQSDQADNNT